MSTYNAAAARFLDPYYAHKTKEAEPYLQQWDQFITASRLEIWRANLAYAKIDLPAELHPSLVQEMYPYDQHVFLDNLKNAIIAGLSQKRKARNIYLDNLYAWSQHNEYMLELVVNNSDLWQRGTVYVWRQRAMMLLPDTAPAGLKWRDTEKSFTKWRNLRKKVDYSARFIMINHGEQPTSTTKHELSCIKDVAKHLPDWYAGYRQILGVA